jgi:hypothetical protein
MYALTCAEIKSGMIAINDQSTIQGETSQVSLCWEVERTRVRWMNSRGPYSPPPFGFHVSKAASTSKRVRVLHRGSEEGKNICGYPS